MSFSCCFFRSTCFHSSSFDDLTIIRARTSHSDGPFALRLRYFLKDLLLGLTNSSLEFITIVNPLRHRRMRSSPPWTHSPMTPSTITLLHYHSLPSWMFSLFTFTLNYFNHYATILRIHIHYSILYSPYISLVARCLALFGLS